MNPERARVLSNAATIMLTVCAMLVTGLVVRRELFPPPSPAQTPQQPRPIQNWTSLTRTGHSMGSPAAKVTIIEFSDFQCPFCRAVQASLLAVREKYPLQLRIVFRHYPLIAIHPYSVPAAVASECAAEQGAFESFHEALFKIQDSLGLVGWERIAQQSGVRDSVRFRECIATQRLAPIVLEDLRVAQAHGLSGTPSIIVNGTLLPGTPSEADLDQYVQEAIKAAP